MEIVLIVWSFLLLLTLIFILLEYIIDKKIGNENRFKKWWRKNIIGIWNNNDPSL
jgi:hypothetical protein